MHPPDARRDGLLELHPEDRARMERFAARFEGAKQAAEFFGRRPRRFVVLPEGAAEPGAGGAKRVHLVRHGEGLHNAFRASERAAGRRPLAKRHNAHEVPAELHDPPLTEAGREEAAAARAAANTCSPQLLVTSPLRRAVQTLLAVFGDHLNAGVPAVAHELCREQFHGLDPSIYDSRRERDEAAREFPQVDFTSHVVPPDSDGAEVRTDPLWWHCGSPFGSCEGGTNEAAMVEHAWQFLCWLMSRPEAEVAVATHALFLLAMYHGALALPGGEPFASPQVLHTGELRSVLLQEVEAPRGAADARLRKWGPLLAGHGGPVDGVCDGGTDGADKELAPSLLDARGGLALGRLGDWGPSEAGLGA